MKYSLVSHYFQTELFQETVSLYLQTVLPGLMEKGAALQAKGRFRGDDRLYDMPYHIHIMNGLIPMLRFYEQDNIARDLIADPQCESYLKVLILGFTFHDANKLVGVDPLQDALSTLVPELSTYRLAEFFLEYEAYVNDICYLALATENRTEVWKALYPPRLNYDELDEVLAKYCHLADGLASMEAFENIPGIYASVIDTLHRSKIPVPIQLSYVQLRANPYTLLSQRLLQIARMVLAEKGCPVILATRYGFIYEGADIDANTYDQILSEASKPLSEVQALDLVKIDFQKCDLGFLTSIPFTREILRQILEKKRNDLLAISPNSEAKVADFVGFERLVHGYVDTLGLPIRIEISGGKLKMRFPDELEDWEEAFVNLFCLTKIKWLNRKLKKEWKAEYKHTISLQAAWEQEIFVSEEVSIHNGDQLRTWLQDQSSQTAYLFTTFFALYQAYNIIMEGEETDWSSWIDACTEDIITTLQPNPPQNVSPLKEMAHRYLNYKASVHKAPWESYQPSIPLKEEMCVFTGAKANQDYKEVSAFSLKARGGSNRTISSLKNDRNRISDLFGEENRLRKSLFPKDIDGELIAYYDFFETQVGIQGDLFDGIAQAKNIDILSDRVLQIDPNVKFYYDLLLQFTKLPKSKKISATKGLFLFVRSHLMLLRNLGIRSYITGTMSPYRPHRPAFYFEDAPRLLRALGWDQVRLDKLDQVLAEINLLDQFGKSKLTANLHRISESRQSYFRLYGELDKDKRKKLQQHFLTFILTYPNLFTHMETVEQLVERALPLKLGFRSGSDETGLLRIALRYLRLNLKEGRSREHTIQQIAAQIDRSLKSNSYRKNDEAVIAFATAIYDELYLGAWEGKLLSLNREKDWIYQFGFLFRQGSIKVLDQRRVERLRSSLAGQPITLESVAKALRQEQPFLEQYAEKYLNLLQNNE